MLRPRPKKASTVMNRLPSRVFFRCLGIHWGRSRNTGTSSSWISTGGTRFLRGAVVRTTSDTWKWLGRPPAVIRFWWRILASRVERFLRLPKRRVLMRSLRLFRFFMTLPPSFVVAQRAFVKKVQYIFNYTIYRYFMQVSVYSNLILAFL